MPLRCEPEDCDDKEFIADPEDKKPEGYGDIEKKIPAPDAKKFLYILVYIRSEFLESSNSALTGIFLYHWEPQLLPEKWFLFKYTLAVELQCLDNKLM
ncbi:Calreticulin [Artemisia annua]|uniref:Calreticulin n=1 Tax=Artemisia annua TaxID=35608 RepID=A0A2U1QG99_ARTAN|nr:Calreticulin [Artemisia annua]